MPEFTYEMRVSSREIERPRLFQAVAHNGAAMVGGLEVHLSIDANGTFEEDDLVTEKDVVTAADGIVYFAWREWPRSGPRRDQVSHIRAAWQGEDIIVYLEDLYE